MSKSILIVDDDPTQRRILEQLVKRYGYISHTADGGEAALEFMAGPGGSEISLIILDLVMPDLDGMGVLERLRPNHAQVPVVVQTAHGGIDNIVSAMRAGAVDFVVKPVSPERLEVCIKNALKVNALEGELTRAKRQVSGNLTFTDIKTRSSEMSRALKLGEKAAVSNIPIMIEGESGVGKEIFARAIQGTSDRRGKPFVTVNCGAIPENLVESILFGHQKGSFTGATENRIGKFVEADGGTLFLDEVSELPLDTQVKLLRAIQEGEVEPVGGKKTVKVDIRLISASNRNMIEHVREGKFREDLYYRLNVFPINVPPLRKRLEDVPLLVDHFITQFSAEEGKRIDGISAEAVAMLQRYDWPGNVRQLENTVFRAVVLAESSTIEVADFPQIATQIGQLHDVMDEDEAAALTTPVPVNGMIKDTEKSGNAHNSAIDLPQSSAVFGEAGQSQLYFNHSIDSGQISTLDGVGELRSLEEIEADAIRFALSHYNGHMSEVARKLGIGRSTLYRKVRELGLEEAI